MVKRGSPAIPISWRRRGGQAGAARVERLSGNEEMLRPKLGARDAQESCALGGVKLKELGWPLDELK